MRLKRNRRAFPAGFLKKEKVYHHQYNRISKKFKYTKTHTRNKFTCASAVKP
ncbi:hypothetical protein CHCC20335_2839 [Bacillus paralicheniformis]|nr:hypothetical protein CHCC20335_2839 [Bacillus paralicheniformis]